MVANSQVDERFRSWSREGQSTSRPAASDQAYAPEATSYGSGADSYFMKEVEDIGASLQEIAEQECPFAMCAGALRRLRQGKFASKTRGSFRRLGQGSGKIGSSLGTSLFTSILLILACLNSCGNNNIKASRLAMAEDELRVSALLTSFAAKHGPEVVSGLLTKASALLQMLESETMLRVKLMLFGMTTVAALTAAVAQLIVQGWRRFQKFRQAQIAESQAQHIPVYVNDFFLT